MELISIIIPVYNVENHLTKCIDSILIQKNINFEILLIDDGSSDRSGEICDEYSRNDERIRVFHQNNHGVSYARNIGINNAKGKWITFVDADDWIEPNSLFQIFEEKNANNSDIIIARSFIINKDNVDHELFPFKKEFSKKCYNGIDLAINQEYLRGNACGLLYKRDFIKLHRILFPLEIKIGEDSTFYHICTIYAESICFLDIHFYNISEREGSTTRSWTFNKLRGMLDNISYINDYIVTHEELSPKAIDILNYRKFGVISSIYNHFQYTTFTLKNYFILREDIKNVLNGKIEVNNIKSNKFQIKILNLSIDLYAIIVILNKRIKSLIKK
jgi:glycosyltransferase involved in cell wall biosynthesis